MKKITISFILVLSLFQVAVSQKNTSINYYLWGNGTYNIIGSDFDGQGNYTINQIGNDNTVILPKFEPNVGWELGFGVSRGNHRLNVALGYTKFNNVTFDNNAGVTWTNEIGKSYIGYYEANYGYRFFYKERLNVSGLIGLGVNTISANGTYDATFYSSYTKYEDLHINLGANMEYYVTKRLFLNATVMYKLSNHGSVKIGRGEYSISGINGSWLSINFGVGVKLGKTASF